MITIQRFLTSLTLGTAMLLSTATAEEPKSMTVIGAGVIVSSGQYLGENVKVIPVPFVYARRGHWFFEGIRGGYRAVESEQWQLDAFLAPRFGPFDADDDPALAGMRDRRMTLEGGLDLRYKPIVDHPLSLRLDGRHDLLGVHEGGVVGAAVAWEIDRGWWAVTPKVGVNWYSDRLMRHLAGVDAAEARAGRPVYTPGDETSLEVGLAARFPLSRTWGLGLITGWEKFGDRFAASPIVTHSSSWNAILGLGRVF